MVLKLLACQIHVPTMTERAEMLQHVRRLAEMIDRCVSEAPVDLVVLPELSTIDYSRAAFDGLAHLAEPLGGPTCELFGALAAKHGLHLAFGMPRVENGDFYISQVVLGPDGSPTGHYDKIHIAQYGASMEKDYFTPGRHLVVFEIDRFRIAPIICYDIRVPELTRTLCVDQGAHLILHCGAYGRDESFFSWHDFVITRAMENLVYIVSLNRAGDFYGSSALCPPWVDEDHPVIVFDRGESIRHFELNLEVLTDTRARYPFLSDRLADYRELPVLSDSKRQAR